MQLSLRPGKLCSCNVDVGCFVFLFFFSKFDFSSGYCVDGVVSFSCLSFSFQYIIVFEKKTLSIRLRCFHHLRWTMLLFQLPSSIHCLSHFISSLWLTFFRIVRDIPAVEGEADYFAVLTVGYHHSQSKYVIAECQRSCRGRRVFFVSQSVLPLWLTLSL